MPAFHQCALKTAAIAVSYSCQVFWAPFLALPLCSWDSEEGQLLALREGFEPYLSYLPVHSTQRGDSEHRADLGYSLSLSLAHRSLKEASYGLALNYQEAATVHISWQRLSFSRALRVGLEGHVQGQHKTESSNSSLNWEDWQGMPPAN